MLKEKEISLFNRLMLVLGIIVLLANLIVYYPIIWLTMGSNNIDEESNFYDEDIDDVY